MINNRGRFKHIFPYGVSNGVHLSRFLFGYTSFVSVVNECTVSCCFLSIVLIEKAEHLYNWSPNREWYLLSHLNTLFHTFQLIFFISVPPSISTCVSFRQTPFVLRGGRWERSSAVELYRQSRHGGKSQCWRFEGGERGGVKARTGPDRWHKDSAV